MFENLFFFYAALTFLPVVVVIGKAFKRRRAHKGTVIAFRPKQNS